MEKLVIVCLLAIAAATPVSWYQQQGLSDFHLDSLVDRNCFRGTYGSLTLFTCPLQRVYVEPFATVSDSVRLCVIETREHEKAGSIASSDEGVKVLFDDHQQYLILGGQEDVEVFPSICSRTSFQGTALNVYYVATGAFRPSVFTEKYTPGAPNPVIQNFISKVTASDIATRINDLAFGVPGDRWNTRNSYAISNAGNGSDATRRAVDWIDRHFRTHGAHVEQRPFRADMCNNVLATFTGRTKPNEYVIVGSHHDSRNTNNNDQRGDAPGADDNGSGTATNLLFAYWIANLSLASQFTRTLQLQTYCGEEQGLLGSANLATDYRNRSVNVVGMINIDMVGYRQPGTVTTFNFMNGSVNVNFTNWGKAVAADYFPSVGVRNTGACCSDQQSWNARSYPALSLFETPTNSAIYPDYHRSTDTPDKVDNDQVALVAQLAYAMALELALG